VIIATPPKRESAPSLPIRFACLIEPPEKYPRSQQLPTVAGIVVNGDVVPSSHLRPPASLTPGSDLGSRHRRILDSGHERFLGRPHALQQQLSWVLTLDLQFPVGVLNDRRTPIYGFTNRSIAVASLGSHILL